ncbi:MAG: hypothetical protein OXR68_06775 [Alphaproteobacteria bacterium]|nr:hypothetical protein [Alphaproteobacteria bacterium]MDD9920308.1 hypothetical protein [Alphaproteobacteria bacterium]
MTNSDCPNYAKTIQPLITQTQAAYNVYRSFTGTDEYGSFFAYAFRSQPSDTPLYMWYVLVDHALRKRIENSILKARIEESSSIVIEEYTHSLDKPTRRLEDIILTECFPNSVNGVLTQTKHPLDYRTAFLKLRELPRAHSYKKVQGLRGIYEYDGAYGVRIIYNNIREYLGSVPTPLDGYRLYDKRLKELKEQYPDDLNIQKRLFNYQSPKWDELVKREGNL